MEINWLHQAPILTIDRTTPSIISLSGRFHATSSAVDANGGALIPSWVSSIDGALGAAAALDLTTLSVGVHTITATAVDAAGKTATAATSVEVRRPAGVASRAAAIDGATAVPDHGKRISALSTSRPAVNSKGKIF